MKNTKPGASLHAAPPRAITILDTRISDDGEARYSLNDLHRAAIASGKASSAHRPANFMRRKETAALASAVARRCSDPSIEPIRIVRGGSGVQGTFAARPIVYAYAMWIDPDFSLDVIEVFDAAQRPQGIPADLYAQALQAERDEAKSFALAQTGSRLMLLRKSEKQELQEQVALMREAVQLRLQLGFAPTQIGVAA